MFKKYMVVWRLLVEVVFDFDGIVFKKYMVVWRRKMMKVDIIMKL